MSLMPFDAERFMADLAKEARATVELINKVAKEVEQELREKESRMESYWMVHRYGRQSGPASKVHHNFQDAYNEAERLARKERDRFVILQAHTLIEPFEPLVITVETIGDPPAGVPYPEPLDPFPVGPPEETEPTEAPCGYGCDEEVVSSNCEIHSRPECTCGPSESESDRCCTHDMIPKPPCPCGCDNEGDPSPINLWLLLKTARNFYGNYQSGCGCELCVDAREKAVDSLRTRECPAQESGRMADCTCSEPDIVTPIPTSPNCECLACTTGTVEG